MFLGVPSMSILNPGIRIFLENLRKPRENSDRFLKRKMVEKNGEPTPRMLCVDLGQEARGFSLLLEQVPGEPTRLRTRWTLGRLPPEGLVAIGRFGGDEV